MKSKPKYRKAVLLNIEFYRAIRNPITYAFWLLIKAPRLRKNRESIIELADLPLDRWQKVLLKELCLWESLFPNLLRPIKTEIIKELNDLRKKQKEPILLLSIGCGGMELERQLIHQLIRMRFNNPILIVGVDYSSAVQDIITSQFSPLVSKELLKIRTIDKIGGDVIAKLKKWASCQRFSVAFLQCNAFDLRTLPLNSFDLVYHTRLKHHLTIDESRKLDELATHLSAKVIEFDDIFGIAALFLTSIFVWRFPNALNGGILSYLRDPSKKELIFQRGSEWEMYTFGKYICSYIKSYKTRDAIMRNTVS